MNAMTIKQRDDRITFIEDTHTYLIDGVHDTQYYSVTQFVHQFIQHFDAHNVIQRMMANPKWPTSKYYNKTPEAITNEWDELRKTAAELGTQMHLAIEQFYNKLIDPETAEEQDPDVIATTEYGYFLNFYKCHDHLIPLRTEWRIFDEMYKLAGSIDMVFLAPTTNGTGTSIYIYDWKRSKEIKQKNWFQRCLPPLSHLDDCNYVHYSLQLNVYKFIIERNYGLHVTQLAIVVMHPNNTDYIKIELPIMEYEIECMMAHRIKQLKKEDTDIKTDVPNAGQASTTIPINQEAS